MPLKSILFLILVLFFLQANASPEATKDTVDTALIVDRLLKLDEMKISDINGFNRQLKDLSKIKNQLSSKQQEFITYLETYLWVIDGDFKEAQAQLQQLFERVDDLSIKIRIKSTLANIQAIRREYDTALNNLDYALKNVEMVADDYLKSKVNLVAAVVYNSLEIHDMSAKYAAIVLQGNIDEVYNCKASAINLRSAIKRSNTYTDKEVHQTIELCKTNGQNEYAYILILDWLFAQLEVAHLSNNMDDVGVILQLLKAKDEEIEQTQQKNLIGIKNMLLAKAYAYNTNYKMATEYANLILANKRKSGNTFQLAEALKILKNEALRQMDHKKAYSLMSQINEAERQIFTENKAKQMAHMTVMHSNLAKQLEIQGLKQNNEVLSLENKLAEASSLKQQLLMFLVLSLLVFLGIWTLRIKRRHDYFKDVAEIDHLTQVFTRKAFEERMKTMLNTYSLKHEIINVAIMDLDHFKLVNDLHGHLVGDWVLKHVILTCEEAINEDMMIARLGGEEFCMVSPGTSELQMRKMTEKIRLAIAQMDCSESGANIHITASFGISNSKVSGYSYSELLNHADLALFAAKNKGRNQVIEYANIANTQVIS